jgi:uncharacterized protein
VSHPGLFVLLGLCLGFLSGVFGVGGSSIATPLLRLLDVPRLTALATPLPVTLPAALVGGFAYWRRGLVDRRIVLWTAAGGVPGVVLGSWLTVMVPGRILMALTGAFVLGVGLHLLRPSVRNRAPGGSHRVPAALLAGVGVGVGFFSGLLANGGGVLLVPVYLLLCRLDTRQAAGTSLVAVGLLALPGTWTHWRLGHIDPRLAFLLAIGVLPGVWIGAHAGLALDRKRAHGLFALFLVIFGLLFLLRTLVRAGEYGWLTEAMDACASHLDASGLLA